jgi:hypothetical protein
MDPDQGDAHRLTATVHLSGPVVEEGPLVRQRCTRCGYAIQDMDLRRIAFMEGMGSPALGWPEGASIGVEEGGGVRFMYVIEDRLLRPDEVICQPAMAMA